MGSMHQRERSNKIYDGVKQGFKTYWNGVTFIVSHPFMLIPFILSLLSSGYLAYTIFGYFDLDNLTITETLGVAFLLTMVSTFTISIAALFVLELLEQHETTGTMKPGQALIDMISKDLWKALPFIIVWSIIDFVLFTLLAIFNSLNNDDNDSWRERSRDYRRRSGVKLFQTTVRMSTMIIFTIIAWEDSTIKEAYQKGVRVFKEKILVLIGGSALSRFVSIIMIGPIISIYLIAEDARIDMTIISYVLFGYWVIVWSFSRLVEQLYVSEYYLWYLKFEEAKEDAVRYHQEVPATMHDIDKPSFTDSIQSLEKAIPYED